MIDRHYMYSALSVGLTLAVGAAGVYVSLASAEVVEPVAVQMDYTSLAPQSLHGTFMWDSDQIPQPLAIDLRNQWSMMDSSRPSLLTASGRATYRLQSGDAHFTYTIVLDVDKNTFQMREANPDVPNFVTDGVHVGVYDPIAKTVAARWHGAPGDDGSLVLVAQ